MEASTVYYTDFRCPVGTSLTEKLRRLCIAAGIKSIDMDGKFVAIKMHFGELGNLAFLRPNYAKVVADLCKEQGGQPFLTDCNTLYIGSRKNALEHMDAAYLNGFSPFSTGCHVIIADGLRGGDDVEVPVVGGEYVKYAKIGRALMDADIVISLTHFKGHEQAGYGGALKNIGMGGGSRAGKMEMHAKGKPHVILEGHSDIAMERQEPSLARKTSPRVCMYAGGVSKQYGLENLVKGFRKADLPDARLEIYGPGDYVQELSQIAAEDSRIFYGGMLLNAEIVEREMAATLLVNPRPTGEEYVKYSFPSKTMEYMSTGTPVLTTVLPGMPKEYHPYVYLLEEETADAIAEKLGQIFAQPAEALFEKGMKAREFILKEKNNVTQAGKILAMLERDGVQ